MNRIFTLLPLALALSAMLYAGNADMQAHHCHGPTPQACAKW